LRGMSRWQKVCLFCISAGVPKRSLIVAIVVGSILNLINQGDALFGHRPVDLIKMILTFLVPYCVATYGAVSYRLQNEAQERRAHQLPADPRKSAS
jgi:hypothetical protein